MKKCFVLTVALLAHFGAAGMGGRLVGLVVKHLPGIRLQVQNFQNNLVKHIAKHWEPLPVDKWPKITPPEEMTYAELLKARENTEGLLKEVNKQFQKLLPEEKVIAKTVIKEVHEKVKAIEWPKGIAKLLTEKQGKKAIQQLEEFEKKKISATNKFEKINLYATRVNREIRKYELKMKLQKEFAKLLGRLRKAPTWFVKQKEPIKKFLFGPSK